MFNVEKIRSALDGGYCEQCSRFDEDLYLEEWHVYFYLLLGFIRRFTMRDYRISSGDPVLAMIVSEIWLFNIGRAIRSGVNLDRSLLNNDSDRSILFPKCNSYSVSQSLGLSPQTVSRKVKELVDRGWVEKGENGRDLFVTAKAEQDILPEIVCETMRDFISTARTIFDLLDIEALGHHK